MIDTVTVTTSPRGESFTVRDGETILDAALGQGIPLSYGCRQGKCSSCKYLVDGDIDVGTVSPYSLSANEEAEGYALVCQAQPLTDLVLHDDRPADTRTRPILSIVASEAVVSSVAPVTTTVWELQLTLDQPMPFYAGQSIEIEVPDHAGTWRSYSLASAPCESSRISLVIKQIDGGLFSGRLDALEPGDRLSVRGPFGSSYLRDGQRPVLLGATGSGIAPIQSILAHAAAIGDDRRFVFYYGARTRADLAVLDALDDIADALDLDVRSCLSQPTDQCAWDGRTGRISRLIQSELSDHDVDAYLCGAPDMCDTLGMLLEAKGVDGANIFYDRFFPANDQPEQQRPLREDTTI